MAVTVTKLEARRLDSCTAAGGPTVRSAIDAFLDTPKIKANPNTLRAYTNVLDRAAGIIDVDRKLAGVADGEIADALTDLWGDAKPATWNRNRHVPADLLGHPPRDIADFVRDHATAFTSADDN